MRILIVNTSHLYGRGDSTYSFNLADLLQSKGHQVAFFAMQAKNNLSDPNSDLFVSNIDFKALNKHKNLKNGLRVLGRIIYSSEARRKFEQMISRFNPDIIHLQNIHGHITPSVIFEAKKHSLPIVWTLHDYKLICPNSHFLIDTTGQICEACGKYAYYKSVLKRCKKGSILASGMAALEAYAHRFLGVRKLVDYFITPSKFLRKKLIERGFPPQKICHIPHFLPSVMFNSNEKDEGYLLFLGKLDPIKGIYPLLEACRLAFEVKIILAGRVEEPLASELPTLLPSNTRYIGFKHGKEFRLLLQNARAVLSPSLCYENAPFAILEAFACGKPVIASDLGGMTELIAPPKRGLIIKPGNVEALAEAMRWMVTYPSNAKEMGHRAQTYALAQHGAELYYQRLINLYSQIKGKIG